MNIHKSININDFIVKEELKENEKEIFSGNQFFVNFFQNQFVGKN